MANKHTRILLKSLARRRLELQSQVYDKATASYKSPSPDQIDELMKGKQDFELAEMMAKYFMDVGLKYKGQVQYCFSDSGGGVGLRAKFDPLRAVTGAFTTQIGAEVGVERSEKLLVMAQRGPSKLGQVVIPCPVIINSFQGVKWSGAASADVFAGVAVELGFKVGGGAGSGETYKKVGSEVFKPESEDGDTEAELLALCFTAAAGARAGVKGGYENFYAQDVSPMYYVADELGKAQEQLRLIFNSGNYKQVVKFSAVNAVNEFRSKLGIYDQLKYERWTGGHIASSDIYDAFRECLDKAKNLNGMDDLAGKALGHMEALSPWLKEDDDPFRPVAATTIRISGSEAAAGAGLLAYAKGEVGLFNVVGAVAGVEAEGLKLDGVYKTTHSRFQTVCPVASRGVKIADRNQKGYVVLTQDTEITHQQVGFTLGSVKASASAKVTGGLFSSGKEAEVERARDLASTETERMLNRMSYASTTICWSYMPESLEWTQIVNMPAVKQLSVKTLEGTGVSYGGSFLLENLLRFYAQDPNEGWWVRPEDKYSAPAIVRDPLEINVRGALKKYEEQTTGAYYFLTSSSNESKAAIDALNKIIHGPEIETKLRPFVEYLLRVKDHPVPGYEDIPQLKIKSSIMGTPTRLYGLLSDAHTQSLSPEDIPNPVKPRDRLISDDVRMYIDSVAASLGVTYDQLSAFLNDNKVFCLMYDLLEREKLSSILLESYFKVPEFGSCTVDIERDGEGVVKLVELSGASPKALLKKSETAALRKLERITLRYRIQDSIGGKKEVFTLGFQAAGQGFGIPIYSVEEAGSCGVVDLHTHWLNGKSNASTRSEGNYEDAIPPVVLFDR